jgi:flavodoxin
MKNFSRRSLLKLAGMGLLAAVPGWGGAPAMAGADSAKTLIIYYSHSGNTRTLARYIQSQAGGDIVELQTITPYPDEYRAVTEQAKREMESGFLPPLQTKIENLDSYERVFIGSPIWWGTIALPVRTFLSEHDLAGKIVAPFVTHGGSGLARSLNDIKGFCPKATVLEGLAVRGDRTAYAQDEAYQWLQKLGLGK